LYHWILSLKFNIGDREGWTGYIDFLSYEELTHPLMYGYDKYRRLFLAIKYHVEINNTIENRCISVFQRYSDDTKLFCNGTSYITGNLFDMRKMEEQYWDLLKELITTGKCYGEYPITLSTH
jgi:hypothetical protein